MLSDDDPECNLDDGSIRDFSIVSVVQRNLTRKHNNHDFLRFQPYFCGQSDACRRHNSRSALAAAVANVEVHFPVVGVLEEMNRTLWAMQFLGEGRFFDGMWDAFGGTEGGFGMIELLKQNNVVEVAWT